MLFQLSYEDMILIACSCGSSGIPRGFPNLSTICWNVRSHIICPSVVNGTLLTSSVQYPSTPSRTRTYIVSLRKPWLSQRSYGPILHFFTRTGF